MGTFLELKAKRGCENQINEAYALLTGDSDQYLICSDEVIRRHIAFIQTTGTNMPLKELRTVKDWKRIFTASGPGRGHIKLLVAAEEPAELARIRRDVEFVLEHRTLFQSICGLEEARAFFDEDVIEHQRTLKLIDESPSFGNLPVSANELYSRCVKYGRPDLWAALLEFKSAPTEASWTVLRDHTVPWSAESFTVWQLVERLALGEDDFDWDESECAQRGRFRDGTVPAYETVREALRED